MSSCQALALASVVFWIVACVALVRWQYWKAFAIREGNRADQVAGWMFENSDVVEGQQ